MRETIRKSEIEYVKGLSYKEAREKYCISQGTRYSSDNIFLESFITITGDKHNWYVGVYRSSIMFVGRTYFKRTIREHSVSYKKGKWYGDLKHLNMDEIALEKFLDYFKLDWIKQLREKYKDTRYGNLNNLDRYIFSKLVLRGIICGTITNEEDFYKAVLKRLYKTDKVYWRIFRDYLIRSCNFELSLVKIINFTKNPNETIKEVIRLSGRENNTKIDDKAMTKIPRCLDVNSEYIKNREKLRLLVDVIDSAILLDQKINAKWSEKRLKQEHQDQINILNKIEIENKDNKSIYEENLIKNIEDEDKRFKLIDTELAACQESLTMDNCLYRCYWPKIQDGKYIAFHVTVDNEIATLGYRVKSLGCNTFNFEFDQCYSSHNSNISDKMKDLVNNYMKNTNIVGNLRVCISNLRQNLNLEENNGDEEIDMNALGLPF